MSIQILRRRASRLLALATVLTFAVVSAAVVRPAGALNRTGVTGSASAPRGDAWVAALKGKHRQLFDAPNSNGGIPLVHVMNYYDSYNKSYGTPDREVNGVLTFYGATTFHGLDDAMWQKYKLGEFLGEKDAAGVPFTANPWRSAPVILGMTLQQASIESLQKRGATFIICNNALGIFASLVAKSRGLDATAVYDDMKAHILPGVTLVPAMVIAIEQAQAAGLTYHRQ